GPQSSIQFINYQLILGVIAVLGHLFPIFAGFRGGKGVATLFGMILAIHFEAAMVCVAVFVILLLLFKYVSLSSICAGFAFPFSVSIVFHTPIQPILLSGICNCILVLKTHQKNIERLLKGKESKVHLFKQQ